MEVNRSKKQVSTKTIVRKRKRRNIDVDVDHHPNRWSDLPSELLGLIKKRLFYADQLNFRAVCKSWRCIEEERLIPPLQQMPWLLVYKYKPHQTYMDSWVLIDPKYKKEYKVDTKSIQKKLNTINPSYRIECLESKYGWLLISSHDYSGTSLFLYSPFLDDNNNCIELPILSSKICMATFTSNPLNDDCTVLTINTSESIQPDTIVINTYRQGHSSWNSLAFKCDQFSPSNVKCWMYTDEGIFYYVIHDGRVGKFDLAREEWKVFPSLPTPMQKTLQRLAYWVPIYMMKSGEGDLFLITECNLRNQRGWRNNGQYIYRLNLSSMTWEDLNSIGEHVLFIGDGYNAVLDSSVLRTKGEQKGISDAIYFCWAFELKYCRARDYTLRNPDHGYPRRRQHCSRHYGRSPYTTPNYWKWLIDPPLPRRPRW